MVESCSPGRRHRILFLDAHDSFSNNITALLTTLLGADVFVLPIDSPLLDPASPTFAADLRHELGHYDAVVCGPGPGTPEKEGDVGLMRHLWALEERDLIPVLGVCLGFQSLAVASGARVRRLRRGLHGMVREIRHRGSSGVETETERVEGDLFDGVESFKATLYHSLCVDVGQDEVSDAEWSRWRWEAPAEYPNVLPLAWAIEEREKGAERVLMAMKHRSKPFWGLQYHPESVCTHAEGNLVVEHWFGEALRWNRRHGRLVAQYTDHIRAASARTPSLLSQVLPQPGAEAAWWTNYGSDCIFESRSLTLPEHIQVPDIVEVLDAAGGERVILESANAAASLRNSTGADVRGRFSIIGLRVDECLRLEYRVPDRHATVTLPRVMDIPVNLSSTIPLNEDQSIWHLLADIQHSRRLDQFPDVPESPFLGGFMGFLTYELGLDRIGVDVAEDRGHNRPDLCLVWVSKSIVVDHAKRLVHIQHLRQRGSADDPWMGQTLSQLQHHHIWQHSFCGDGTEVHKSRQDVIMRKEQRRRTKIRTPGAEGYEAKVRQCQDFIAAGESYELCLTDQTTITRPRSDSRTTQLNNGAPSPRKRRFSNRTPSSWQLYKTLRARQPAPFASYLRLGGATLVSASPERFLQYGTDGLCSMRPMKGTVRKSDAVATLEHAETILHVPKEEAENLMIVDLVRHDLHGICGAGNVTVRDLMKVEEYRSVFQMITVVEGQLPLSGQLSMHSCCGKGEWQQQQHDEERRYTGLDVLAASFPPGSMTGAPKKRSCELLRQIERGKERSLYSGVVGYMDVRGRGDWSVTIRSMFRWDDEQDDETNGPDEPHEVWHIGAGGAVTILSTAEGEREEMFTKLAGPLGIFSEFG